MKKMLLSALSVISFSACAMQVAQTPMANNAAMEVDETKAQVKERLNALRRTLANIANQIRHSQNLTYAQETALVNQLLVIRERLNEIRDQLNQIDDMQLIRLLGQVNHRFDETTKLLF